MSEQADRDQKTEAPTEKRKREAVKDGDVLQSRELATALVILVGAGWLALAGPMFVDALSKMLTEGLTIQSGDIKNFSPGLAMGKLLAMVALPLAGLFLATLIAAIGAPALLGSLGFRTGAFAFKANKMNPLSGIKRIFGPNGLIELVKSLAKVLLLGAIGAWLLTSRINGIVGMSSSDIRAAIGDVGSDFVIAVLIMAAGLAAIALIDVPAQTMQRIGRLRMTKQEVKDEMKQVEGSPELKAALRRRQHEAAAGSARSAMKEATVVLTNPTHFAVALRYKLGEDSAPIVVAKGRGALADAIRQMAKDMDVPMLSYPQLTRALYFTTRTGQFIREDLYMAVATVLSFVFNLDVARAAGAAQPVVDVPVGARFDTSGRPES